VKSSLRSAVTLCSFVRRESTVSVVYESKEEKPTRLERERKTNGTGSLFFYPLILFPQRNIILLEPSYSSIFLTHSTPSYCQSQSRKSGESTEERKGTNETAFSFLTSTISLLAIES